MKYKVGDKVRIKNLDWYNQNKDKNDNVPLIESTNSYYNFSKLMRGLCGKVMTISGVKSNYYDMVEDYGDYFWTDEMIEGLAEEESEKKLSDESWKPSKEEMDVLYGLTYITSQYDEHKEEIITRLYQDLKREFFNGSSYENMFPDTEDNVRRRSTIQVLEYARSLDNYNQYGKEDIDKNIAWLEKQDKKPQGKSAPEAINERNIDSQNYLKPANKVEPKFRAGESSNLPQGYQFVDENSNIINAQKIALEKKKKEYPKTYEECCKIIKIDKKYTLEGEIIRISNYKITLLESFQKLLICRNAYWKIADDWKEKRKEKSMHYVIYSTLLGEVVKETMPNCIGNYLLDFPTQEMCDAFYENFNELIEQCKELL